MPKIQTAQNHAMFDPLFHFILIPIFLINFIASLTFTVRDWPISPGLHLWEIVVSLALLLLTFKTRIYSLADQDRIIRLEERLRITALAPSADVYRLSTRQLIALRFASDAELPALVARTLAENLDPKTIKQNITTWRPDNQRI
jgi:hypothetical protein